MSLILILSSAAFTTQKELVFSTLIWILFGIYNHLFIYFFLAIACYMFRRPVYAYELWYTCKPFFLFLF